MQKKNLVIVRFFEKFHDLNGWRDFQKIFYFIKVSFSYRQKTVLCENVVRRRNGNRARAKYRSGEEGWAHDFAEKSVDRLRNVGKTVL